MELSVLILVLTFVVLLFLNVPIAISIGVASFAAMLATIDFIPAAMTMAQRMGGGINSFSLLAIPFFILSGLLMGRGGIAHRLIEFAKVVIGMLPGGLAFVNIISCTLFGAISGSAVAATSAIGGFMIPTMNKEGYDKNFNAAVTVASSTTGLLIPPSNILIVYSLASGGVSIAALFVAGYLPGLLVALSLMVVCAIYAKIHNYPVGKIPTAREFARKSIDAVPSLMLIVLVIGGIIGGFFTATEASVVAVLYALSLSVFVYKEVRVSDLPDILVKSVETTAIVMLLIGTSTAMSWMLSYENIPQSISAALMGLSDNPFIILLTINLILLCVGVFMDMTPAVLIFTPIFLPVAVELGMSPLHFGIMMVLNLCIGLCTPPVGAVLFVGCGIAKTTIGQLIKPLMPMYAAMVVALLLVAYVPAISEFLPIFFDLYDKP
ncbi:TRAP transporter large permease [Saccharophagus degradans]|uniref:TRAP transporter large permease protein n=2 Tax=Saccharophagus degradans TaxID=86304 RepID=Q21M83_SACD2|nr:TRAP transporter large permease subunit [Saccharophagus degradans]ABD80196.1 TRAP dicarboxylate transporter- DctM subunit [Saccharophagus degradans 2-40]MBU2987540.1 TRAP transporter large permease subunit [Saccharophagus degradans]MDO6424105.1 TRAP transporter large permease subunit [Saccharophagus degradans]MDO6609474.1 TRAP transporter large permease subunit [Saccharophagus degradans]WGO97630.1 TRAP transporter large permease subunit [Saccharophagus degradans]